MTDEGFISAVRFNVKKDKQPRSKREVKSWGRRPMLCRARRAEDLEQIRPYYHKLRVEAVTAADYKYRAVVPHNRWVAFVTAKAEEIEYDSHFKEAAQSRLKKLFPNKPEISSEYYSKLMSVWSTMFGMQSGTPKWTNYGTGKPSSKGKTTTAPDISKYEGTTYASGGYGASKPNPSAYSSAYGTGAKPTTPPPALTGMVAVGGERKNFSISDLDTVSGMAAALMSVPPTQIVTDDFTPQYCKVLLRYAEGNFADSLTLPDVVWCVDSVLEAANLGEDEPLWELNEDDCRELQGWLLDSTLEGVAAQD